MQIIRNEDLLPTTRKSSTRQFSSCGTIFSLAASFGPQTSVVCGGIANGMPTISIFVVTL